MRLINIQLATYFDVSHALVSFVRCPREANVVCHELDRLATLVPPSTWIEEPPTSIVRWLVKDVTVFWFNKDPKVSIKNIHLASIYRVNIYYWVAITTNIMTNFANSYNKQPKNIRKHQNRESCSSNLAVLCASLPSSSHLVLLFDLHPQVHRSPLMVVVLCSEIPGDIFCHAFLLHMQSSLPWLIWTPC